MHVLLQLILFNMDSRLHLQSRLDCTYIHISMPVLLLFNYLILLLLLLFI